VADIIRIVSLTNDEIEVIVDGIDKDFDAKLTHLKIKLSDKTRATLRRYMREIVEEHLEPFK